MISICYDEYRDIVYEAGDKCDVKQYNVENYKWYDWNWKFKLGSSVIVLFKWYIAWIYRGDAKKRYIGWIENMKHIEKLVH